MFDKCKKLLLQILHFEISPAQIWILLNAFLKGTFYIVWYRLFRKNVKIKFPFMVYGPVSILGEGSVFIDEMCSVFYSIHEGLTIVTLSPYAHVYIGKCCDLAGLTIRCNNSVTIGDHVMSASCLIQDVMFIDGRSNIINQSDRGMYDNKEIIIGNYAWLCTLSCVLSGSELCHGSVLSVGSCTCDQKSGNYKLIMGNPVKKMISIDRLLRLKGVE
jgi:acetyltransferase-like isoleucine patch superfamily enzyme